MFDKYEARGFFEIDMRFINDKFVSDVKSDIQLLENLRKQWFGDDKVIQFDPKLNSFVKIVQKMMKDDPMQTDCVF